MTCWARMRVATSTGDTANDLMARNHAIAKGLQLAFDDVQVGPAHAAGADAQQDLARCRRGNRNIEDFEGARRDGRRTR